MNSQLLISIADALVNSGVSPVLTVVGFFIAGYVIVGVPLHITRGPGYRDGWGTMAGLLAGLLYLTLVFGIHPGMHWGALQAGNVQRVSR